MIGTIERIYVDYVEIKLGVLTIQLPLDALPVGLRQGDRVKVKLSLQAYRGSARARGADVSLTLAWE